MHGGELEDTPRMGVGGGPAGERDNIREEALVGKGKDKVPKETELSSVSVPVFLRSSLQMLFLMLICQHFFLDVN